MRILWMAEWISDAGGFVTFVALAVFIHSLTGGVAAVGFALGLQSIASFLFGPFAGVLADRVDRRRVMVACDLIRAGLVALLPFTHAAWEAYALAFVSALFDPLFRAARQAMLPLIAPGPKLVPALTVRDTTHNVLHMVGPAFGGLVVLAVGARRAFFVDAATFVISAAFLARIASRGRPEASGHSPVRDFVEGVVVVFREPVVRTYNLINAVSALSGAGVVALLVVYVRDQLRLPGGDFGLVLAVAGLATVVATVTVAVRDDRHPRTPWAIVAAVAGGAFVFMLLRPPFLVLLILAAFLGLQDGAIGVPSSAATAERIPDRFRGRAAAAEAGLWELFFAVGSIGFAWLGDPRRLGVRPTMALAASVGVVLSLAILAFGGLAAIVHGERLRMAQLRAEAEDVGGP